MPEEYDGEDDDDRKMHDLEEFVAEVSEYILAI